MIAKSHFTSFALAHKSCITKITVFSFIRCTQVHEFISCTLTSIFHHICALWHAVCSSDQDCFKPFAECFLTRRRVRNVLWQLVIRFWVNDPNSPFTVSLYKAWWMHWLYCIIVEEVLWWFIKTVIGYVTKAQKHITDTISKTAFETQEANFANKTICKQPTGWYYNSNFFMIQCAKESTGLKHTMIFKKSKYCTDNVSINEI